MIRARGVAGDIKKNTTLIAKKALVHTEIITTVGIITPILAADKSIKGKTSTSFKKSMSKSNKNLSNIK